MLSPLSLLLIGLLVLLAVAVLLVVRSTRKDSAQKRRIAKELGFSPVADSAPLMRHLTAVRGRQRPGQLRLSQVFQRTESLGDLWLYDLYRHDFNEGDPRPGKSPDTPLELGVVAVVVPGWNWPRSVATPRLLGKGNLTGIANRMADTLVEANARQLDFPDIFGLDEYYYVACYEKVPDLPESFLLALAASPGLLIHLGGDTLTVSWANARTQTPDTARMRHLIDQARRFAQTLGA